MVRLLVRFYLSSAVLLLTACNMDVSIKDLVTERDFSLSTITATSPGIADGASSVTVTIVVRDRGVPVQGFIPTFSASGLGNILGACTPTDSTGRSTCQLRSTGAGIKNLVLTAPPLLASTNTVFNPNVPSLQALAITSGGRLTSGGALSSNSSIGQITSPVVLESAGAPRARVGLQGILYEP